MRKILLTILSLGVLTTFAMPKAAIFGEVFSAPSTATISATAEEAITKTNSTQLLAPASYEQYLSLSAPTDVAVTENYTAIADGNAIHVYDRVDEVYRTYTHGSDSPQYKITKIQFDSSDKLYFLDGATSLHVLDPLKLDEADAKATTTELVCSSFTISGNYLYFSNSSGNELQISRTPLSNLTFAGAKTLVSDLSPNSSLAVFNNELYYTDSGKYLSKTAINGSGKPTFITAFSTKLYSMTIHKNVFYCVTADGNFQSYDLETLSKEQTPILNESGDYSAVSLSGNYLYTVQPNAIRQYSIENSAFTAYEISDSSASIGRLNGATDVCLAEEKLYLSDVGNKRITVYDTATKDFLPSIPIKEKVTHLASDGKTLLTANPSFAALYSLDEEEYGKQLISTTDRIDGNLVGAACIYGKYYLLTDKNRFYTLLEQDGEWTWQTAQKNSTRYPSLLTADLYGNLYVVCENSVYLYSENNFTTATPSDEVLLTNLPNGVEKISVDYRGNLYALVGNSLHVFQTNSVAAGPYTQTKTFSLNANLVYGDVGNAQSFAFSYTDNQTYVLYKGDYLSVTEQLNLPTMQNIPVANTDDSIFADTQAVFTAVRVKANAITVEFDIQTLKNATVFPYLDYQRTKTEQTAVKIGSVADYNVLAIYNAKTNRYATCLVLASACQPLSTSEYRVDYSKAEQTVAYLSSDVHFYKFPYATALLTTGSATRSAQITLLGEINGLDRDYYYVSYTNSQGKTTTGYIPKACTAPTNGEVENETLVLGNTDTNKGAYGRLAYILLGTAVILLLTDYLILRTPKEDNNEQSS